MLSIQRSDPRLRFEAAEPNVDISRRPGESAGRMGPDRVTPAGNLTRKPLAGETDA